MKEVIIFSVLLILCSLFIGHVSIGIKPFSFSLPYWHRSVGLILIVLGFILFNSGEHAKGYEDGLKKGRELATTELTKMIDEIKGQQKK